MKHLWALLVLMAVGTQARADIFAVFRYDDGRTN
jgi:hypothetical protein